MFLNETVERCGYDNINDGARIVRLKLAFECMMRWLLFCQVYIRSIQVVKLSPPLHVFWAWITFLFGMNERTGFGSGECSQCNLSTCTDECKTTSISLCCLVGLKDIFMVIFVGSALSKQVVQFYS